MRRSFSPIRRFTASIALAIALTVGWLGTSGCSSASNFDAQPVTPNELPEYSVELEQQGDPDYDEDGYDVSLGFDLRADDEFQYNAIAQEIVQEAVYYRYDGRRIRETLTLVEAFKLHRVGTDRDGTVRYRLKPFQRDRHFERGYSTVSPMIKRIEVCRVVRFYPAFIKDADWTPLGFAHLPQNRMGSIVTTIPDNFNETHQRKYLTTGEVLQDDRTRSHWYHMKYRWWREPSGKRPQANFWFIEGSRPVQEPDWIKRTIDVGMLRASAGE